MKGTFTKINIKTIKKNPLIDKLKDKQEVSLRNCRKRKDSSPKSFI